MRRARATGTTSDALARHRFGSLVETLSEYPSFVSRPMFGCVGCYLDGRLVLVLADRVEPWQGLLLPTERSAHASLLAEFKSLRVHPVLGKWLYLPYASDRFPSTAAVLLGRIADGDPRFGVEGASPRLPRPGESTVGQRRRRSRTTVR